MTEPLFWNPLPSAAEWLAQRTGRPMDARTLVDTVAKMGKMQSDAPTVIQMMLPKNTRCASLSMFGKPAPLPETDAEKFTRERLVKMYGPLPNGITYLSEAHPTRDNLCVNNLLELLMYGEVTTGLLLNKNPLNGGMVWLMPWGTEYTATLETCGINRADLLALGDILTKAATPAPAQTASVVPASDGPAPLTRNEIANCFAGLRGWDVKRWKSELSSPDDWLKDCQQRKGTRGRGGYESTWWPVCIAVAMVERDDTTAKLVSARFKTMEPLKPWRDAWENNYPEAI